MAAVIIDYRSFYDQKMAATAVNSKLPLCRGNPNYRYKTKVTPLKRSKKYLSPEYFYSFWGGNYKRKILIEKVRKHAFDQGKRKIHKKKKITRFLPKKSKIISIYLSIYLRNKKERKHANDQRKK